MIFFSWEKIMKKKSLTFSRCFNYKHRCPGTSILFIIHYFCNLDLKPGLYKENNHAEVRFQLSFKAALLKSHFDMSVLL